MTDAIVKVYYGNLMMLPDVSRVITCLHEKNIKFDLINMSKGKHSVPFDFLKLQENPSSRVLGPVFDDGSKMLFESREICRYLPENYAQQGNKYLLGINTLDRASIEQWIRSEKHSFDPPSWNLVFHLAFASFIDLEPKRALIQESERKLSEVLDVYNQRLAESKFLAGNHFTLADLVHLPNTHYLANSKEWSYLFTSRKNVKKWWKKISQRESWLQTIQRIDEVANGGRSSLVGSSSKGIPPHKSEVYSPKITELSIDDHISSPSKLENHQQHVPQHKPEAFQSSKKHKREKKSAKSSNVTSPRVSHHTEAFKPSQVHFDEENPLKRSIHPISFEPDPLSISEIKPSYPYDPSEIPFLETESPKTEPILPRQPTDLYPLKPKGQEVDNDNQILIEPTHLPIYQSGESTDIPTFDPQRNPPSTHKKETQPKPQEKIATSIPPVHIPNQETYQFYEESMHPESNMPEHLHQTKKTVEDEVSQPHIFYSQNVPPGTKYYNLEPPTSSIQYIQKITTTPLGKTTTEPKLPTKENPNQNPTFPVPLESDMSYHNKESSKPSHENIEKSTRAIHELEAHGSNPPPSANQSQNVEFQKPPPKNTKSSTKETSSKLAPFMPTQSKYVPYTKQPTDPHLGKTGIPRGTTLNTINLEPKLPIPPEAQVSSSKPSVDLSSDTQETTSHHQTPPNHQLDEHLKKEFKNAPVQPSISASQPKDFQPSQTKNDLPYPKSEDRQFVQYLDQMDEFDPSRKIHPSIVPQKEDLELIGPKDKTNHHKQPELGHKKAQESPFSQNYMEKRGHNLPRSTYLSKSAQLESFKPLPKPVELETNMPSKQPNALQSPKAKNDLAYPNAENTEISDYLMKKKNDFISEEPGETSSLNLPKEENSKIPKHTDRTSNQKALDPLLFQDSKEKRAHSSPPEHFLLKNTLLEPINQSLISPEPKPSEIKNDLPYSDSEDIQTIKYLNKKQVGLHPLGTAIPSVTSEEDSNFSEPRVEISHQKSIDQPQSQEPKEKRENLILQDSLPRESDAQRPHEKSYMSDLHELEPSQHTHGNLEPFKLDHPKFVPKKGDKLYKPASKIKLPVQDESYLAEESKENKLTLSPLSRDSFQMTQPETLMISEPLINPESDKLKSPEVDKDVKIRTEKTILEPTTKTPSVPEQKSLETLAKTNHFESYNHERKTPQVFGQENNALGDHSLDIHPKERYTEMNETTDLVDPNHQHTHKDFISTELPILLNPQPFPNPPMQNVEKITPVIPVETTPSTKPMFQMQEINEFPNSIDSSPQHVIQKKVTESQKPTVVDTHKYLSSDKPHYKIKSSKPSQGNIEQFTGSIHESEDHGSDQTQLIRSGQIIEFQKPKLEYIEPYEQSLDSQTHKLEPLQHGQKESEKEFTQNPLRPSNPVSQSKDHQSSQTKIGIHYPESKDTRSIEYLDRMTKFHPTRVTSLIIPKKEDSKLIGTEPPLSQDTKENRTGLDNEKPQDNPVSEDSQENREEKTPVSSLPKITQLDFKKVPKSVELETQESLHHPDTQPQPQNELPDQYAKEAEFSHYLKKKKNDFILENTKMSEPKAKTSHQKPLDPSLNASSQMTHPETLMISEASIDQEFQNPKSQEPVKEIQVMPEATNVLRDLPKDMQSEERQMEEKDGTDFLDSTLQSTQKEVISPSELPTFFGNQPETSQPTSQAELSWQAQTPVEEILGESSSQTDRTETPLIQEGFQPLRQEKSSPIDGQPGFLKPQDVQSVERQMEEKESTDILDSTLQYTQKEVNSPSELSTILRNQLETPQPAQSFIEKKTSAPLKQIIEASKLPKDLIQVEQDVPQPPKNTLETSPLPTTQAKSQSLKPIQLPLLPTPENGANQPFKSSQESLEKNETTNPQATIIPNTQPEIEPTNIKSGFSKLTESNNSNEKEKTNTSQQPLLPRKDDGDNQSFNPSIDSYMQKHKVQRIVKSSVEETILSTMKPSYIPTSQAEPSQQTQKKTPVEEILGESASQQNQEETILNQEEFQPLQRVQISPMDTQPGFPKPAQEPLENKEASTPQSIIIPSTEAEINPVDIKSGPSNFTDFYKKEESNTSQPPLLPKIDEVANQSIKPSNDSSMQKKQIRRIVKSSVDEIISSTMKPSHLPTSQAELSWQTPTPIEEILRESSSRTDQAEPSSIQEEVQALDTMKSTPGPNFQSDPPKEAQTAVEKLFAQSPSKPTKMEVHFGQEDPQPFEQEHSSLADTSKKFKSTQKSIEDKQISTPITNTQPEERSNLPLGPKENIKSSNTPQLPLSTPKDEDHMLSEKLIETPDREPIVSDNTKSSLGETTNTSIVNPPVSPFLNLQSPKQGQASPQKPTGTSSSAKLPLPKDTSSSTTPILPTPQNEANQPSKLPIDSSPRTPASKSSTSNSSQDIKPAETSTKKIVSQNIFQTPEVALPSRENHSRPLDELESSENKTPKKNPLSQNYPKATPTKTEIGDKPSSFKSPLSPQSSPPKRSQSSEPPTGP